MYTHYPNILNPDQPLRVIEIAQDVSDIITASEILIADGKGQPGAPAPDVRPSSISFNGVGGASCESFDYPPDSRWNRTWTEEVELCFCKASRQNYDIVVCASIIAVKHHLEDNVRVVASDSDLTSPKWQKRPKPLPARHPPQTPGPALTEPERQPE